MTGRKRTVQGFRYHTRPVTRDVMLSALAMVIAGIVLISAQLFAQERTGSPSESTVRATYLLGADDVLLVRVADAPEIGSQPVRIDPAGNIRLPMVGTVAAAGRSIDAVEAELVKRLMQFIQAPDVSISVSEFQSQPVSVIGAVRQSGIHQLKGPKTLIEILSLAGGVGPEAGPTVKVTRRKEWGALTAPGATADPTGTFTSVEIELKPLLSAQTPEKNVVIRPHDLITVAAAEVVYVIGEVGRPGSIPVTGASITVMEAVSAASGALRSANAESARILRKQPGSELRTEVPVDLKKMMAGKAGDITMLAGDILVVPDAPGRRGLMRALELGAQAGISIGTYGLIR